MEDFYRITIVMEMLAVNLFTVDICARRKYSRAKCYAVLVVFTFILTSFTNGMWKYMGFDKGNATFALIGIVYLLPLSVIYKEKLHLLLSILFTAWIYTMTVYCISVRLAYYWPLKDLTRNVFIIQSILYAVTSFLFIHWIRNAFLFILGNITHINRYILQLVSLCWFLSIIIVNANLIYMDSILLKISAIVAMAANASLSYLLVFSMVMGHSRVRSLEDIIYVDNLTKLYNRAGLFKDAPELLRKRKAFRLIFIDLNSFKQINDQYGHVAGDEYLVCFANDISSLLGEEDTLYRMSGDEFIIVSPGTMHAELMDKLSNFPRTLHGMDIAFLGFSVGWADYPEEADTLDQLVSLADTRMYQNKPDQDRYRKHL